MAVAELVRVEVLDVVDEVVTVAVVVLVKKAVLRIVLVLFFVGSGLLLIRQRHASTISFTTAKPSDL